MKKRNKKRFTIIIIVLLLILVVGLLYFVINFRNKNALSLEENKWIESNKYNVIDVAVINDLPILSYNGSGMVYDYINYITEKHSLKFNVIPYKLDNDVEYNYSLEITSSASDNDIVLLKDSLVLIMSSNYQYTDVNNITNLKIGVSTLDKDLIKSYLNNVELVEYETYSLLGQAILNGTEEIPAAVDGIIIPKLLFTKQIIENNYKISYYFNDLNKYYIIKTDGNTNLNSIMKKSFNTWRELNYFDSYNNNLLNNYYLFKGMSDTEQKRLQSKNYEYGFIDYGIYNNLSGNKISGFNELILKDFNKFSGLSIKYTKYNSISKLLKDFNSNNIDFVMNICNNNLYNSDIYETSGTFNKELAIVSGIANTDIIDNIYSLKDKEVATIKDSYLEKYLIDVGAKVKLYNNIDDLTSDFSNSDIAIIDLEIYNYYKTSAFKDAKINYILPVSEKYNYIINNTADNTGFKDIFDFYLNYNSMNELVSKNYETIAYQNVNIVYILVLIIIVLCIYLIVDFSNHVKYLLKRIRKNKKINLSKEDKIKYIDQLTSLKNRAYLNSKIEMWDSSEIYPQAVIIIDLNNISYINDNYGREEGDKVITEAANILIQNQLQNSEIIRTDGNEFLVYLVGYNEKQIISYLRKLNKELNGLSHGFGAASGYSIIMDAIKTFDDAVNEATLDMKNNKEDIDY